MGSTFEVTHEFEFMKSDDPLFRPCQMVAGPGRGHVRLRLADRFRRRRQLAGNGKNGRIYRLTWAGTGDQPALAPRRLDSWAKLANSPPASCKSCWSPMPERPAPRAARAGQRGGDEIRKLLLKDLRDPSRSVLRRVAALGRPQLDLEREA